MKPPAPQTMPEKLAIPPFPAKLHYEEMDETIRSEEMNGRLEGRGTLGTKRYMAELVARWNSHDSLVRQRDALAEALEPFANMDNEGSEDFPDHAPVVVKFGRTAHFALNLGMIRRANRVLSEIVLDDSTLKPEGAKGE